MKFFIDTMERRLELSSLFVKPAEFPEPERRNRARHGNRVNRFAMEFDPPNRDG